MSSNSTKDNRKQPSPSGGSGRGATSEPQNLYVDLRNTSKKELELLSLCSIAASDLSDRNHLPQKIKAKRLSELGEPIANPAGIPAVPDRPEPRRHGHRPCNGGQQNKDSADKLAAERVDQRSGEKVEVVENDDGARRRRRRERRIVGRNGDLTSPVMVTVESNDDEDEEGERKRRRKGKGKVVDEHEVESEGVGFILVRGEKINLKFLAHEGDRAFGDALRRMTDGMVAEEEVVEFLKGLKGWPCGDGEKTKVVAAGDILKGVLPDKWKMVLSIPRRNRTFSLCCQRFMSPGGTELKTCREVAFYLRNCFGSNIVNPPEEEGITEKVNDQEAASSSNHAEMTEDNLSETNLDLHSVPICVDISCRCETCQAASEKIIELQEQGIYQGIITTEGGIPQR